MAVEFKSKKTNPENPGVFDIEPQDLWSQRQNLVIVDVRRPDEFTGELGHIPGAQLMVLDTLPQRLQELPKEKTVVFVCRSGGRSGRATAHALSQGYKDVFNMRGGMLLWNELGLETESEA